MNEVIKDIYQLFESQPNIQEEWCKDLATNLSRMLKNRLQERQDEYKLRLSTMGQGDRKLWYSVRKDIPKEELRPETRLKFLLGDIVEEMFISLIKLSGHKVTDEQKEVVLHGVKGHIDCKVDGEIVDIKSAASLSFKKFEEETLYANDPFGYYAQGAAYEDAEGTKFAGWMVMDKQLGKMCFSRALNQFKPDMDSRVKHVIQMVKQNVEPDHCELPEEDGKSGNMKLSTTCSYCAFKKHCWRDSNNGYGLRTFLYASGPRFLTEVKSLPKVPEVTYEFQSD